eukprot:scaffold31919_cov160-Skeletonema_menzelii.AAC.3
MQIVEKPYLEWVPQLGQVVLPAWRERFLMAVSAEVGMVVRLYSYLASFMKRGDGGLAGHFPLA